MHMNLKQPLNLKVVIQAGMRKNVQYAGLRSAMTQAIKEAQ